MATGTRRRLRYREAKEFLERRHGPPVGDEAIGRLAHILWWMIVGKRRFIPDGPTAQVVRAEKKRARQARRRNRSRRR